MAVICLNGVWCVKSSQLFILAIICTCFEWSHQTLLDNSLEKELEVDLFTVDASRLNRQTKTVYDASGIPQSPECGLNRFSVNRPKRNDNEPQGPYDWPWIAAILDKRGYVQFCGGALLNRQYILTAAHCFDYKGKTKAATDIVVRLGEWDLFETNETKVQEIFASKIEVHEQWEPSNERNDIALIKLERSVNYDRYTRPLCLPSKDVKPNQMMFVAGWGSTSYERMDHSNILLDVAVPIIAHKKCQDLVGMSNSVDKHGNICAGGELGKDSCEGDSGGPLVFQETDGNKRWMAAGIVSWGIDCGQRLPGVYTNVRHYLNWIKVKIVDAAL